MGDGVTPATDVFAWGATLTFAATGMPPFGRDAIGVLAHRITHEPPELGALTGDLRDLVTECLHKDPARRPTASALLMRLLGHSTVPGGQQAQTILAEGVTAAAVLPPAADAPEPAPAGGTRRRKWAPAVIGAAGALALAGGVIIGLAAYHPDDRPPPLPGPTTTVYTGSTTPPPRRGPSGAGRSSPAAVHPAPRPVLAVEPSGCDLGATGLSCTVTLSASGATTHWTATAADPLSLSPSNGSLEPGGTGTVTITLHPPSPRVTGSATVVFTGGGQTHTVQVTWEGEPDPGSSPS